MKRSRVVAAGAERATEMRVGWKETIALSPAALGVGCLGLDRFRAWASRATFSSLAGLTSLWRNASSSRLRLGVSSAEWGYVSRCTSLTSSRFSVCSLSIRRWMSSTFSGPARAPPDPRSLDVRGGERLAVARGRISIVAAVVTAWRSRRCSDAPACWAPGRFFLPAAGGPDA